MLDCLKTWVEYKLYLYIFLYPILSTYVFFGQELIDLITEGSRSVPQDKMSIALYATLLISIVGSFVIFYHLHISIRQRSMKKFTYGFVSHYILLVFSYSIFAIKYSQAERTKVNHVSIDIARYLYFWLFTLQFAANADFKEILRNENSDFPKTRLIGVRVENLLLMQILLALCAFPHASYVLAAGFYSQKLDTIFKSGQLVTSLVFALGVLASFFIGVNSFILYTGVKKESLDWIRFHYILKLNVYNFYSFASYFHDRMRRVYVPSSRNEPFSSKFEYFFIRILFIFELWVLVIYQHLLKRRKEYRNRESPNTILPNVYEENNWDNLDVETKRLVEKAHISEWKISHDETQKLGEGTYAKVFRGKLRCGTFGLKDLPVAVKILKQTGLEDGNYTNILVSEIKSLLLSKNHSSLLGIYGITRCRDKPCVVMEYCPHGSLLLYLLDKQNHKSILNSQNNSLDRWALQIANGLQFLKNMNIVHGDLAARNVLLDSEINAKISDFGMSIRLYNYQMYAISSSFSVFPWRWMAPESLSDLKFSTQSDIWAYGVTLWEIYSFGLIPWQGFEWTSDFVRIVKQGKALHKPPYASDDMYASVMCRCWCVEENERIQVKEIVTFFSPKDENLKLS